MIRGAGSIPESASPSRNCAFLNGVTAGVVGLIAATAWGLFHEAVTSVPALVIFLLSLLAVYRWKARAAVVGIMAGAGALGWIFFHS